MKPPKSPPHALSFRELLELSYEDLLTSARAATDSPLTEFYRAVLLAFYAGNSEQVGKLAAEAAKLEFSPALPRLVLLRHQILIRNVDPSLVQEIIAQAAEAGDWRGELLIVAGQGHEIRRELAPAKELYLQADRALQSIGAERKALRAYLNAVAMEGQLHPDKKLLPEFHAIYRRGKKIREYRSSGIALSNIAREYRNIRALDSALRFANLAVRYLKKEFGSVHYYKALTNRCHILYELDRQREARTDFEEASHADFPEVQAALQVIRQLIHPESNIPIREEALQPLWQERLREGKLTTGKACRLNRSKLGELEEALIRHIFAAPSGTMELIEFLYGTRGDIHSAEARLKSLLSRLRKKCPGLIVRVDGKYRIADVSFLPSFLKEAG